MNISDVLIRPIVTEKSTSQAAQPCYVFSVGMAANKIQIKSAIESYYGVRVQAVRVSIVRGKSKRTGNRQGRRSNWKKAYVRLAAGESINLFGE
ncbi:MAG TPA: 50S ribosomal protein L23 [Myxococcota bacterium]|nr:50S ribosomal protein L23 [Myxococcota bacterium]